MVSREHKKAALHEKLQLLRSITNSHAVISFSHISISVLLFICSSLFLFISNLGIQRKLGFVCSVAAKQGLDYSGCIKIHRGAKAESRKIESRYSNSSKFNPPKSSHGINTIFQSGVSC